MADISEKGYGLSFTLFVTGTAYPVFGIVGGDFPEMEKVLVESTFHGSGTYPLFHDTTQKQVNAWPLNLTWNKASSGHAALLIAFGLTTGVAFVTTLPDGGMVSGSCHIQKIGRVATMKDIQRAVVTVQPNGGMIYS